MPAMPEYLRLKVTVEVEFSVSGAEYPEAVRQVTEKRRQLGTARRSSAWR